MNNRYFVSSNIESGHGRYDIQLRPFNKRLPGIIIELKVLKDGIAEERLDSQLEAAAKDALSQIEERKYVTTMMQEGFTNFFKIGAAFYKKHVIFFYRMIQKVPQNHLCFFFHLFIGGKQIRYHNSPESTFMCRPNAVVRVLNGKGTLCLHTKLLAGF